MRIYLLQEIYLKRMKLHTQLQFSFNDNIEDNTCRNELYKEGKDIYLLGKLK